MASTMITLTRTNSNNPDYQTLIEALDRYLALMDGDDHAFYAQYNGSAHINHVVIAYDLNEILGCGAIKAFDADRAEVKRMYVVPTKRQQGIAARILNELESWARELGYKQCILETGKKQLEAVSFYPRCGYNVMENYGPYAGVEDSICFRKTL